MPVRMSVTLLSGGYWRGVASRVESPRFSPTGGRPNIAGMTRSVPLVVVLLAGWLALAPSLRAQGSPPMNTNDPAVVGKGVLEVNLGFAHTRSAGGRDTEFPIVDLNYGLSESAQVSYVAAWLSSRPAGARRESGLTNSTAGVKWRFHDGGKGGAQVSVHPQLEFNNPGSNSERKGLADAGATFILPLQWQREIAGWTITTDVGRVFHFQRADEWFLGTSAGREISDTVTLGVELVAEAAKQFDRSALLLNFGGSVKVSARDALLFAVGRELHRHGSDRATLVGYLGWQRTFK